MNNRPPPGPLGTGSASLWWSEDPLFPNTGSEETERLPSSKAVAEKRQLSV